MRSCRFPELLSARSEPCCAPATTRTQHMQADVRPCVLRQFSRDVFCKRHLVTGNNRCSDATVPIHVSCACCHFYLAVGAGREQQQIAEQLLMNHFIFTALHHQLPHLLTQNTQRALAENKGVCA